MPELHNQKSPEWEQPSDRSIFLWEGRAPGSTADDDFRPWLDPYPLDDGKPHGAVMVLPGGGYVCRVKHESAVIAREFNRLGFHAFVCHYRVLPHRHPAQLYDAARAVRIIRCLHKQWDVERDHIAVCGFSAGGHLAAMLGVHYGESNPGDDANLDVISARPDALILSYAVISGRIMRPLYENLLGDMASDLLINKLSLDLHVTENTPPSFLWQTADDPVVPVENSILFARALRTRNVPYEMHIYPSGPHGLALAPDNPHIAGWTGLCAEWLNGMGWKEA